MIDLARSSSRRGWSRAPYGAPCSCRLPSGPGESCLVNWRRERRVSGWDDPGLVGLRGPVLPTRACRGGPAACGAGVVGPVAGRGPVRAGPPGRPAWDRCGWLAWDRVEARDGTGVGAHAAAGTVRSRAGTPPRASGSLIRNWQPGPALRTPIWPECASTMPRAMDRPSPAPSSARRARGLAAERHVEHARQVPGRDAAARVGHGHAGHPALDSASTSTPPSAGVCRSRW